MSGVHVPLLFNHNLTFFYSIYLPLGSPCSLVIFIDFYLLKRRTWRALIGWLWWWDCIEMVGVGELTHTICQSWWELVDATVDWWKKLDDMDMTVDQQLLYTYTWWFGDIWRYGDMKRRNYKSSSPNLDYFLYHWFNLSPLVLDPRWFVHPITTVSLPARQQSINAQPLKLHRSKQVTHLELKHWMQSHRQPLVKQKG